MTKIELTKLFYHITSMGIFDRHFGLRDQIRRFGIAISNGAEGFERGEMQKPDRELLDQRFHTITW